MPPLTVIHTTAWLAPRYGGMAHSVPALCLALRHAGVNARLVGLDVGRSEFTRKHPELISSTTFAPSWVNNRFRIALPWRYSGLLKQDCHRFRPALVHDHGMWLPNNLLSARTASRLGLPLIISPRGTLEPWSMHHKGRKKAFAWNLYQRRALESAKLLHATSDQEADAFRSLGLGQPIAIVANGVDAPPPIAARREAGPRTVLFMSRLHPVKGIVDLLEAWSDIRPTGWRLCIAGGDEEDYLQVLKQRCAELDIASSVSFPGFLGGEAKWRQYAAADLFVLPSHSENFGLVVAEALASGIPVITTTATPWHQLPEKECGWYVPVGRAHITSALRKAIALSDEARKAMGERGKALIEASYSWTIAAERMITVYEWVSHGGTPPPCIRLG